MSLFEIESQIFAFKNLRFAFKANPHKLASFGSDISLVWAVYNSVLIPKPTQENHAEGCFILAYTHFLHCYPYSN